MSRFASARLLIAALALSVAAADVSSESRQEAPTVEWPILELRQYTLHPGQRDTLIELFEREFIEGQEATGMKLVGQFRDLDNPDRFVWMRAFRDMPARAASLQEFYTGPVWQANRNAANTTMVDSDNVLLLHAAAPSGDFMLAGEKRADRDAKGPGQGIVGATIYYFERGREREFVTYFKRQVRPLLNEAGIDPCGAFLSETSANNFPRLPVRANDFVFVWFARFADEAQRAEKLRRLQESPRWGAIQPQLNGWFKRAPDSLRLEPTARSLLHG